MDVIAAFSRRILFASLALGLVGVIPAANLERRPITVDDFEAWRSITSQTLSRDGRWLAYASMPLEGDGEVVVRELASGREQRVPVGALPPPPLTASEENPERPAPRREVGLALTSDARFAVATTFPARADLLAAKRAKKQAAELPQEGLALVDLTAGTVVQVDRVRNFQLPARGGSWLAYLKIAAPEANHAKEPNPSSEKNAAKPPPTKDEKLGTPLVLRDLQSGRERTFTDVLEYSFARDGRTLVFTVSARDRAQNGVFAVTPGSEEAPLPLVRRPGRYQKLIWDRTQTQLAFVGDHATTEEKAPHAALYHWTRGESAASEILSAASPGVPARWMISGDAAPAFSVDGRRLQVSTLPLKESPDPRLAALLEEEKVSADLWRWNDDFIPPVQKVRAEQDRKRAYAGLLDLATRRFVQVADRDVAVVTFTDDGARAFGFDDRPYRRQLDYDGLRRDLYLIDVETGARRLLAQALDERAGVRWSHEGRWLAYFSQRQWFVVDARDGARRSLTADLPVAFHDELSDVLEEPGAYGAAGWTSDGESLVIYDRYDLWQVFPDGRPARNLTAGFGRAEKIQLRHQPISAREPEDPRRGIDPADPLVLRGESEVTRATGFFRTTLHAASVPERLLWAEKNHRYLTRSSEADVLLLTASRFDEYPDLHTTDSAFSAPTKVSDGGAQLKRFLWGSAELLRYRNAEGVELSAALFKPAGFDPAKKYPLIVYIYERLSQTVHSFVHPVPSAYLSPTTATSNGYLVLMPDIVYTAGRPGQSAADCVLPAVDEVVRRGSVDESAIGLSGHSWGGYQTAWLITHTNRFRAAQAGAVVGNMTSAYSGIRWGSGRARQFQYEKTQSRIGPPLTAAPQLYLENSPVFAAHRVQTPVLLIHNDQDDAVPWEQGIEFFLALRRHGKEAYLFNYNGEFHGLRKRANQIDFSRRMLQFFDHFLKGAPAPDWMTQGIPYLERDREKLRFNPPPSEKS